jgi:hypothetical protein
VPEVADVGLKGSGVAAFIAFVSKAGIGEMSKGNSTTLTESVRQNRRPCAGMVIYRLNSRRFFGVSSGVGWLFQLVR